METGRLLDRRWGGDTLPDRLARGAEADDVSGWETKATPWEDVLGGIVVGPGAWVVSICRLAMVDETIPAVRDGRGAGVEMVKDDESSGFRDPKRSD